MTSTPLLREWASGKAARREDAEAAVNAIPFAKEMRFLWNSRKNEQYLTSTQRFNYTYTYNASDFFINSK